MNFRPDMMIPVLATGLLVTQLALAGGSTSPSLEGGEWKLVTLLDHSGQVSQALPDTQISLLLSDGKASGSAGCNRYHGSYRSERAGQLALSPRVATTLMACPDPITRQEQIYLRHLAGISAYRIDAGALWLSDAHGKPLLQFVRLPAPALEHTDWEARGINNGRGGVVSRASTHRVTARFSDGKVVGSAGCNQYHASYEIRDDELVIGVANTTRKHCGDPPELMQQEQEYLQALGKSRRFILRDRSLELRDEEGALMVRFERKSGDSR